MQRSEQVLRIKLVQQQLKELEAQRDQIIKEMIPDVRRAILAMMDWEQVIFDNIGVDFLSESIKASVTIPKDPGCRYVFTVKLLKDDCFKVELDFREDFSRY